MLRGRVVEQNFEMAILANSSGPASILSYAGSGQDRVGKESD
jgi:hypothetical protein